MDSCRWHSVEFRALQRANHRGKLHSESNQRCRHDEIRLGNDHSKCPCNCGFHQPECCRHSNRRDAAIHSNGYRIHEYGSDVVSHERNDLKLGTLYGPGHCWNICCEGDERCRYNKVGLCDDYCDSGTASGIGVSQSNCSFITDRRDSAIHDDRHRHNEHRSHLVSDRRHSVRFRAVYSSEYRRDLRRTSDERCGYNEDGFCQCHGDRPASGNRDQSDVGIFADGCDAAVLCHGYRNHKYGCDMVCERRHGIQFRCVYGVGNTRHLHHHSY